MLNGNWRYDSRGAVPDQRIWGIERTIFNLDCPQMRFAITTPGEYSERHKACARGDFSVFDYNLISRRPRHSIKFSPSRNVPSIAGDINRRFLATFQDEWKRAQAEEKKRKEEIELFKIQTQMLRKILPNMRRGSGYTDHTRGQFYADLHDLEFTLYGDSVRIDRLDLSLDEFVKLAFSLRSNNNS